MDFKTKMLVASYRGYIGLFGRFSPERAAAIALDRFLRPRFRKARSKTMPIFQSAEVIFEEVDRERIAHYHWKGRSERSILLAHGWESDAGTFGPMVEYFLDAGWSIRAIDAPAHGQSSGSSVNLPLYSRIITHFLGKYPDIDLAAGHSFGGMALAHAAYTRTSPGFPRGVIIGSALELRQSLAPFIELLRMSTAVQQALYNRIERLSGRPVPWYSIDRMLGQNNIPFLIAHDRNDNVCPIRDLEPLINKAPEHIEFHITDGLGHNRILKEPSTWVRMATFAEKP